jgi:multiple sugar transport system permease protein
VDWDQGEGRGLGFDVQDNLPVLIVTCLATTLPVALYTLANYRQAIPSKIEQAGLTNGCSRMGAIWRITLPLAIPALVSVAIYTFMIAGFEFLIALVFLNSRDFLTMPIEINTTFNDPTPRPNMVTATPTAMTIPIIIFFLALERFLEQGLTAGGVKGWSLARGCASLRAEQACVMLIACKLRWAPISG